MRASLSALATATAGMLLYSLGDSANQLAMFSNSQRMPVVANACLLDPTPFGDDVHVCLTSQTHLRLLCDIFHVGHVVYSIGDFGLYLGTALLIPATAVYLFTLARSLQKKFGI